MAQTSKALDGRIAVVTGATAGIGRAIALDLARLGAHVVVNGRREGLLNDLAAEIDDLAGDDHTLAVAGDAADAAVVRRLLDEPKARWGREADCVVVNAGRGLRGSVLDSDTSQWEEMVRTNLLGAAMLIREAGVRMSAGREDLPAASVRDWRELGARDVVVLGSTVGRHISPFSSMYGSTKFAVNSLAEAARRELAPRGVRVTLIEPGVVRSEFQRVAEYDAETFGAFMDRIGPVIEPEDVARVVSFVVSQAAHVHVNDVVVRPTRQEYP